MKHAGEAVLQILDKHEDDFVRRVNVGGNLPIQFTKVKFRSANDVPKYQSILKLKHHQKPREQIVCLFALHIELYLHTNILFKGFLVVAMMLIVEKVRL